MSDPIPMRLPCPSCGVLHVDEGEFATKPHHTHACQECGMVWRPAIVHTVGVRFLPGYRDEVPATDIRPDRDVLTDRWLELANSWPTDGWDGAAQARASHAEKVRGVEAMLGHLHDHQGHGPVEIDGQPGAAPYVGRCLCGKAATTPGVFVTDRRVIYFDRSSRTHRYLDEVIAP